MTLFLNFLEELQGFESADSFHCVAENIYSVLAISKPWSILCNKLWRCMALLLWSSWLQIPVFTVNLLLSGIQSSTLCVQSIFFIPNFILFFNYYLFLYLVFLCLTRGRVSVTLFLDILEKYFMVLRVQISFIVLRRTSTLFWSFRSRDQSSATICGDAGRCCSELHGCNYLTLQWISSCQVPIQSWTLCVRLHCSFISYYNQISSHAMAIVWIIRFGELSGGHSFPFAFYTGSSRCWKLRELL